MKKILIRTSCPSRNCPSSFLQILSLSYVESRRDSDSVPVTVQFLKPGTGHFSSLSADLLTETTLCCWQLGRTRLTLIFVACPLRSLLLWFMTGGGQGGGGGQHPNSAPFGKHRGSGRKPNAKVYRKAPKPGRRNLRMNLNPQNFLEWADYCYREVLYL